MDVVTISHWLAYCVWPQCITLPLTRSIHLLPTPFETESNNMAKCDDMWVSNNCFFIAYLSGHYGHCIEYHAFLSFGPPNICFGKEISKCLSVIAQIISLWLKWCINQSCTNNGVSCATFPAFSFFQTFYFWVNGLQSSAFRRKCIHFGYIKLPSFS